MLPFAREAFLDLFGSYNAAIWPAQVAAYALALTGLAALARPGPAISRLAFAGLGLMWIWTGIVYHGLFFAAINPGAYGFALLFAAQGVAMLALAGRRAAQLGWRNDAAGAAGKVLILYALIIYPLIGALTGEWARTPRFGTTPCPVTLFTLGLLLLARPRPALGYWIAPLLWSLIGGTAAFLLGIVQDWVLLAAGPAALMFAFGVPAGMKAPAARVRRRP